MKLPPLNALRCFEAAARLLSLKLAASELLWSNLNGHFDRVFSPRQGT